MANEDRFVELCNPLTTVFPREAPAIVSDDGHGDLDYVEEAFSLHGSDWNREAVFTNRSAINFVNDAALLFLLPRLIFYSVADGVLDPDVLDYVVCGLSHKMDQFQTLFSSARREALIPTLRYLQARVLEDWPDSESSSAEIRSIIEALRSPSRPGT